MTDTFERLTTALADRYRIEHELGAGGMATVYLAHDVKHNRKVAVKVLRPELAAILGPERFLKEIEVTANLQHPHILPLFDSGEADSFLYYVMPCVAGESLREKLNREKQLAIDEAVRIATEVASALDYANRENVIHRDIKPENILLQDGHAVVADFGIALAVSDAGADRLTQTGISLGTPEYMSPEQAITSRHLDARSDIYSLGCVVFEMLTGEPPYSGATVQAIFAKRLSDPVPSACRLRDIVSPAVDAALARALGKTPADRFPRATDLAEALSVPKTDIEAAAQNAGVGSRKSIVVLPFDNLSPDANDAYFSDGLTEEVITSLSHLNSLRVISRRSAMTLKGTQMDVRTIGKELEVEYVLEGGVRKAGNNLRITAQLIDAGTDEHLWAERYDGTLDDVFSIQEKVSQAIVDALDLTINPRERADWAILLQCALAVDSAGAEQALSENTKAFLWNDPEAPWFIASAYALAGAKEEALRWLERTVDRGWINYPLFSHQDPLLESIRGEERFQNLMHKVEAAWNAFEIPLEQG